jgi:hypothetical protein
MEKNNEQNLNTQSPENIVEEDVDVAENALPTPTDMRDDEEIEVTYHGLSDRNTDDGRMVEAARHRMASGEPTTEDVNANQYQAKVMGEEAVGGLTPTPEQNVTEELERAVGVEGAQKEPAQVRDKLERRDERRWELDPESSRDYEQRRE